MLDGVDYSSIFTEPSALEQVYAIFANVLEFDETGHVINAKHAEHRAAQYAAPGNGAMTSQFHILRFWGAVPERQRWER